MSNPQIGNVLDSVHVEIDYEIIQHFSKYLYSSPNKAVEELVTNGFDAMATWVHVFLPGGGFTPEKIAVWDNGDSMDVEGLKALWWIANSPKIRKNRPAPKNYKGVQSRDVIGKFGIGKLASYTLAKQIAHLCRVSVDEFLLVEMDYEQMMEKLDSSLSSETAESRVESRIRRRYDSPIRQLNKDGPRDYLENCFANFDESIAKLFENDHWTIAILSELKDVELTQGRLAWVLGNGMPLRPDFQILVDMHPVKPKLERSGVDKRWNLGDPEVIDTLKIDWGDKDRPLEQKLVFGTQQGLDPNAPTDDIPYVQFPNLGRVWGKITLYTDSLELRQENDGERHGRSYGFFLMVKHRLINAGDDRLLLHDPSFGTFYRSQYVLHVDGLDEDLLADRERITLQTPRTQELKILQLAVYHVSLARQRQRDQELASAASLARRLPTGSRTHFLEPLQALLVRRATDMQLSLLDFKNPQIERKAKGEDQPMASLADNQAGFTINLSHPYFTAITKIAGRGQKGSQILREYENIAISEQLFEGFLFDLGIEDERVSAVMQWRDKMYRELASVSRSTIEQLGAELREASHLGGEAFESKIVDVLERMGFVASRDAASGKKDVLVFAPASDKTYKIIFEAKGKKAEGGIPNDAAEVAGANSHRVDAAAEHAVIVAREFVGFTRTDTPAIFKECLAIEGGTRVSIMTVEALIEMLRVMDRYGFALDEVKHILTTLETPEQKLASITALDRPFDGFDYNKLLEHIWEKQKVLGRGKVISSLTIFQEYYQDTLTFDEFKIKLTALTTMAFPLIDLRADNDNVALRQSPDQVLTRINRTIQQPSTDTL